MKRSLWIYVLLLAGVTLACGNQEETDNTSNDTVADSTAVVEVENDGCKLTDVNGWDEFMNIPYRCNELDLKKRIGEFTGGEYSEDSTSFIYYFKRVARAPVTVWVDAKNGDVLTVFVEILGYEEYFDDDVADLQKEFDVDDCDVMFFGKSAGEIIEIFGKPVRDEKKDEGVRSISYDSDDMSIALNFKFYESQGGRCSSISLNWFY